MIGVEPEAGDDVARSLAAGERVRIQVGKTIADGQQAATPGELTWPIITALVAEVVTVTDVRSSTRCASFERMKLVVEPSGASAFAALLGASMRVEGRRVGVVLSGGNIGADALASCWRAESVGRLRRRSRWARRPARFDRLDDGVGGRVDHHDELDALQVTQMWPSD